MPKSELKLICGLEYKLFTSGPFDPRLCSAACDAQPAYNRQYPPSDGSETSICRFFNTYILLKNGVNQGQYCSLYTEAWNSSYGTNVGQWDSAGNHYTINYSFSYHNPTEVANQICVSTVISSSTSTAATSTVTAWQVTVYSIA